MSSVGKFPVLFECNRLVKGSLRFIIVDLQRQSYVVIPNELAGVILDFKDNSLEDIYEKYSYLGDNLNKNIELLVEKEIIFLTNEPSLFSSLSLSWKHYSPITNCIIDYSPDFIKLIPNICKMLSDIGCENVQIRIFHYIKIN
jgi:hypothetical protein